MVEEVHSQTDWFQDSKFQEIIKSISSQFKALKDDIRPKTSIYEFHSESAIGHTNIPHFVSIGPIHCHRPHLQARQEIKLLYSMFFFFRSRDSAEMLKECGKAIINIDKEAREYYAQDTKEFDKYKLMKILLVDGCFLLELFFRHSGEKEYTYLKRNEEYQEIDSSSEDLILGNPWMRSAVCQDLVLLENQIPLTVLETLLSMIKPFLKCKTSSIKDYSLCFFSSTLNYRDTVSICINKEEQRHILEILHKSLTPSWTPDPNGKKNYALKHCATKLLESGVNIKKKFDILNNNDNFDTENFDRRLLEIVFDTEKGILLVPPFWMGGITNLIVRNLVAFEQYSFRKSESRHITAYVIFMKSLIRSERDVKLLKHKGIITEHPGSGSNENVLDFFNACCEGVGLRDFYFSKVCEQVEEYRCWKHFRSCLTCAQGRRRKYQSVLARRYCPDACTTIAFFAATLLLALTCLQTFYTVYPYYHPRK